MKATEVLRQAMAFGLVVTGLAVGGTTTASATPTSIPTPAASATVDSGGHSRWRLAGLTDLVADRIEVGDKVAAAKFGTDRPIEDPVREQQVLDAARASAITLGLDPDETVAFFRDQIEASKIVQRGLFQRWTEHPSEAPTVRPDLNEIRVELDGLTTALLQELVRTERIRHAGLFCRIDLAGATHSTRSAHDFDRLHAQALTRAVTSICVRSARR